MSGVSRDEPSGGPSLSSELAELDRRLRALQEELAAAERPRASAAAPLAARRESRTDLAAPERLAEELAVAIIARAEEHAERIVAAAHERVRAINQQAEELLGLQESLRRSARELLQTHAEALARLEAAGGEEPRAPIA